MTIQVGGSGQFNRKAKGKDTDTKLAGLQAARRIARRYAFQRGEDWCMCEWCRLDRELTAAIEREQKLPEGPMSAEEDLKAAREFHYERCDACPYSTESPLHTTWIEALARFRAQAREAAERERDALLYTSDKQTVAWKARAEKAEKERDEARVAVYALHASIESVTKEWNEALKNAEQRCIAHAAFTAEGDCVYCDWEGEKERAEAAEQRVRELEEAHERRQP